MLPEKSIIRNQNLELQKNIYIALLVHWLRCRHRGSQLFFHITRYVLKRRREDTFGGGGPKVKIEFGHLFSLQKRFSLCSSHKINANIDVFC
jgi:hypothetical protein